VPGSRALGASEGRMPKRSGQAESGCHDGIRERPATGTGSPERRDQRVYEVSITVAPSATNDGSSDTMISRGAEP